MILRPRCVLAMALAGLLLAGCGPFVDATQPRDDGLPVTGSRLGQTLVAMHDGLTAVDVYLGSAAQPVNALLRKDLGGEPVASAQASASNGGWIRLAFSPLADSHGRRYFLDLSAPGSLTIASGPPDAYADGALYVDGRPQEGQLAFRLVYDPGYLLLGMLRWLASGLLPGVAALGLLLLPGGALLAWLQPRDGRTGRRVAASGVWTSLVLAATLSMSLLPLLMLAAKLAGLRLGPLAAWGLLGISTLALAARLTLYPSDRQAMRTSLTRPRGLADRAWSLAMLVVVGLIIAVRLLVTRSVQVPLFGDSVEHTAIVQLMLDNGGLYESWLPYAAFRTMTVHFGFHGATAFLAWLIGADAPRAVVLAGQMWNVLAVLALYPLASSLAASGSRGVQGQDQGRWAGLGAVLIAGLLATTPMFYVNWGRYAQLAGLALLPGALILLWQAIEAPRWQAGRLLLAAVALAGMILAYYRTAFFYAAFILALGTAYLASRLFTSPPDGTRLGQRARAWLDTAGRPAAVGALAALLMSPYMIRLWHGYLDETVADTTAYGAALTIGQVLDGYRDWQAVTRYISGALLAVAGLALVWSLVRRRWAVAAVGLWGAMLVVINALQLLSLPGAMLMSHFAVMISLYLPVSILGGWLLARAGDHLQREDRVESLSHWRPLLLAAIVMALAVWGAWDRVRTLDQSYVLVTRPDELAMDWIAAYTPPDAVFFVNGFTIYDGTSAVGSDAGWWIPLLAGRQNTMPPQYALFDEVEVEPGYQEAVVDLVRQWEVAPFSPEAWDAACRLGVTHLYVGQLQGQVGIPPSRPLFSAADLLASPAVEAIYHQDRVWVFALRAGTCPD